MPHFQTPIAKNKNLSTFKKTTTAPFRKSNSHHYQERFSHADKNALPWERLDRRKQESSLIPVYEICGPFPEAKFTQNISRRLPRTARLVHIQNWRPWGAYIIEQFKYLRIIKK